MKIAFYVQHLLGTGHLFRMMALAKTFSAHNHAVLFISGGAIPNPGEMPYQVIQLFPLRTGAGDFTRLIDGDGQDVTDRTKQRRAAELIHHMLDFAPDILIIESFPFGRFQMKFELIPLLKAIKHSVSSALIISSIRDILQHRKEKRNRETLALLASYFDAVIVHGDPAWAPLECSFPFAPKIPVNVFYSGYVIDETKRVEQKNPDKEGKHEVIVSAGGGAVGKYVFDVAIKARPLSCLSHLVWRILAGNNVSTIARDETGNCHSGKIIIEENREDFCRLLSQCELSISQAGYNTCLDIIRTRANAVLIPFSGYGETEQRQRAAIWQKKELAVIVPEADLNPENLARAVAVASRLPRVESVAINMNGAQKTLSIVENLYQGSARR